MGQFFKNITKKISDTFNESLGYSNSETNLGDFQKNVDPTAKRTYFETGFIKDIQPKNMEVLMQEPDITVVVKKRMFSSLIENYQSELMSSADKKLMKASKRLFQNKCNAIAAYEKLTKIEKLVSHTGFLDEGLFPVITASVDVLSVTGIIQDSKFIQAIDTLRKYQSYAKTSNITSWMNNPKYSENDVGEGTGTFELTLVSGIDTTTSVAGFGNGGGSIQLDNPYNLLFVSSTDIDNAIADVFSKTNNSQLFQLTKNNLTKQTQDLTSQLNESRSERNVLPIKIETNYYARKDKAVRIFTTSGEIFYNYDPGVVGVNVSYKDSGVTFDDSAYQGYNGLSKFEARILGVIINNTYHILSLQLQNNKLLSDIENANNREEIEYVKENMRLNFRNKCIVQPMDEVTIFANTKSRFDTAIAGINTSSFFGYKNNLLSAFNQGINNFNNALDTTRAFFGNTESSFVEQEKNAIVGPEFPMWLWIYLRNNITKGSAETCIFSGLCINSNVSFSGDSYKCSISLKDKANYFDMGQIASKPSLSNFDKEIYDPLTPFKENYDGFSNGEMPELLEENKKLFKTGIPKVNTGSISVNSFVNEGIYTVGDKNLSTKTNQNIFYDPDGMVYRWKNGIGIFTLDSVNNNVNNNRYADQSGSVPITTSAFAGQDAINVLSLLVTGIPYNYSTFFKAASDSGNNFLDNPKYISTYFQSLMTDLKKSNAIWGNFVPYKKLTMNQEAISFMISGQFEAEQLKAGLKSLINERASFFDKLRAIDNGDSVNGDFSNLTIPDISSPTKNIQEQLRELDIKINSKNIELNKLINSNQSNMLNDVGSDISYSTDPTNQTEQSKQDSKRDERRRIRNLTRRLLWKVKANEDSNLFIIDEQYDRNSSISAFEKELANNLNNFKCEYGNTMDLIKTVKNILGLEIFANTQGHIEVKLPGFNKIPSSVFYNIISSKERVFPKQLESLFTNQADSLISSLEIIEDKIRASCSILNKNTDYDCLSFINSESVQSNSSGVFSWLTNEDTGRFGSVNFSIANLIKKSNVEYEEETASKGLTPYIERISGQTKLNNVFGSARQKTLIQSNDIIAEVSSGEVSQATSYRYNKIKDRLAIKYVLLQSVNNAIVDKDNIQTEILKNCNDIASLISERQNVIKTLSSIMKNLQDGLSLNDNPEARRSVLYPNLQRKSEIPSIIEHLIEDEDFDDLGPGSGSRYVIKDSQIKSISIAETPPQWTVVEVHGVVGDFQNKGTQGLEIGRTNGNGQTSAFAVDYNMWRMYGFKQAQGISAPWITNPNTQGAIVAHQQLLNERRRIFSGTCEISGNEYMQPGEVIYIESMDLLFYVETVKHQFSFTSGFSTTLSLTYGHNPGEYFPTMMDVIGNTLYSNAFAHPQFKNFRNNNSNGDQHIGTIVIGSDEELILKNSYKEYNQKQLKNILIALSGNFPSKDGKAPVIEVRHFYNSSKGYSNIMSAKFELIKNWLANPTNYTNTSPHQSVLDSSFISQAFKSGSEVSDSNASNKAIDISDDKFKYVAIDCGKQIDNVNELSSPSSEAWNMARDVVESKNISNNESETIQSSQMSLQPEEIAMYTYVLDVWVSFKDIKTIVQETSKYNSAVGLGNY